MSSTYNDLVLPTVLLSITAVLLEDIAGNLRPWVWSKVGAVDRIFIRMCHVCYISPVPPPFEDA